MGVPLSDIASVIRSKNAGPFLVTLDVIFDDALTYERLRDAQVISRKMIAELYRIKEDQIVGLFYNDAGRAIKITLNRRVPSGDFEDTDVYGAQQYLPLLNLEVPEA